MRIGIALAAVIALTGCVSQEKYRVKEQEADKYRTDWQKEVEARKAIRAQFETVQREFEAMQSDVKALQNKAKSDEDNLTGKQAELRKAQDLLAAQALVEFEEQGSALPLAQVTYREENGITSLAEVRTPQRILRFTAVPLAQERQTAVLP